MTAPTDDQRLADAVSAPVDQQVAAALSSGDAAAWVEKLGDALERSAARDPQRAAEHGHALMELATQPALAAQPDMARALARVRRATTLALAYAGRLDSAVELGHVNRTHALRAGQAVEAARALLSLMHPLLKLGKSEDALTAGAAAHSEFMAAGRPDLAARADINLGNVRKARGEVAQSIVHLDRALANLGGDAALAAHIENTRGEALLSLDRCTEARTAFLRAMAWAKQSGAGFASGVIEGNLAEVAARAGALHEALELFARARDTVTAPGHNARLRLEEADVLLALGLAPAAAERLRQTLPEVDARGLAFEGLRAALALAGTLATLGQTTDALATADDAVRRAQQLKDALGESRAHTLRALLHADLGRTAQADEALARAAALQPAPAPSEAVGRLLVASRVALKAGRAESALAAARTAAALAEGLGAAPLECDAHVQCAKAARAQGQHAAAAQAALAAVTASERVRASLGSDLLRRAYLGRAAEAHEEHVLACLAAPGPHAAARALEAAERGKGRSLVERLLAGSVGAADAAALQPAADGSHHAQLEQAHASLEAMYRQLAQPGAMEQTGQGLRSAIAALEQRIAQLEVEVVARSAHHAAMLDQPSAARIQAALAADEALIAFTRADGLWLAFVATPSQVHAVELGRLDAEIAACTQQLEFHVRKAFRDARNGRTPAAAVANSVLARLGASLWQPVEQRVALPERLILVPHGQLHALPFAALVTERGAVIERHTISTLPSASLLPALREAGPGAERGAPREVAPAAERGAPREALHAATAGGPMLVVGVADECAPRVREEAVAVAAALHVTPLLDGACSAHAVGAALQTAHAAHLACHGQFMPEAPWSSGLRMADRWFGVRDIAQLTRTPAEVVLSGCDTAGLSVQAGDELTGLVHALMSRGTARVVASVWSAHDDSAARIMVEMYACAHTLAGRQPLRPEFLRSAQQAERGRSPHPAFWAPFTFTGVCS